jgi:hypothetical protein
MVDWLARSELQIYLVRNVIYLFLFGLFVTFRSPKPQCPTMCLVPLKSLRLVRVHHNGFFVMFGPMVQMFLNIEQFFHWKFNIIKTYNWFFNSILVFSFNTLGKFQGTFLVLLESPWWWVKFYEKDIIISRPNMSRCWILSNLCHCKFN